MAVKYFNEKNNEVQLNEPVPTAQNETKYNFSHLL